MRIVLDAMGSDQHPDPEIKAALQAANSLGIEVLLVGKEDLLAPMLKSAGEHPKVQIVHADKTLDMEDKPAVSARRNDTSMAVGIELIKNGEAEAFVTAGNTGGAMATSLFRLGRIRGVKRPALTALFPVRNGHAVVLDIGANTECKPEYLLQFAVMGSIYAEKVLGKKQPRVALLSNGEEEGKGNALVKETYPLLKDSGLNFVGNIEGKELFGGETDVVVMDGFTGNVLLKSSEAVARLITEMLREELMSSMRTQVGALLAKPAFNKMRVMMDPAEVGAAPLLGINGLIFVGHGRSDDRALFNALKVAQQAVNSDLLVALREAIQARLEEVKVKETI